MLCCPVCWEFFEVLEAEMSDLDVEALLPGKHAVLHPVQLPDSLPSTIVEKMMEQFRNYLRCELEFWMQRPNILLPPPAAKRRCRYAVRNSTTASLAGDTSLRPKPFATFLSDIG